MSVLVGLGAVPKVDSPAGEPVTKRIRSHQESGVKKIRVMIYRVSHVTYHQDDRS